MQFAGLATGVHDGIIQLAARKTVRETIRLELGIKNINN